MKPKESITLGQSDQNGNRQLKIELKSDYLVKTQ